MAATVKPNPALDPRVGFSSRPAPARSSFWKRGPLGILIVAVHVILIYVAATTMGILKMPDMVKPIEAIFIDQPQEQHEPVKVIKPEMETPTLDPPPIVDTIPEIEVPVDEPAPAAITAETAPTQPAETSDMKVTNRVDPVYPPASRRAGEEGTGVYRVLVDANGRPLEVQVLRSSGFPRLDEAAVTAIHKWRFRAAVANGQAVQTWTRVQVQFKLENA